MAPRTEVDSGLRERKVTKNVDATSESVADAAGKSTAKGEFTWQDVAKHNTPKSAWVIIRGVVYDVTEWADRHPGGAELIHLHAGRECTDTFDSYHPFSNRAEKILGKYAIGKLVGPNEFPVYKPDSGFYRECAQRVNEYFKTNNLDPKAPFGAIWRMTLVFLVAALAYAGMNALIPGNVYTMYFWGAVFGVCQALPLLHVMHDSSHAAWSSSPTGWFIVGRGVFDWFAGGCMVSWLNQHIVGHHIYTNVAGADPDLPVNFKSDVRRIVERQVLLPIYKFQHLYLPPLYGVLGLKFRIQDIFETFISLTNGPIRVNPHPLSSWVHMLTAKSFWAFYRIYIPLTFFNLDTSTFWGVFLLAEFVTGWYLAFNFQVSHVSTECDYPNGDEAAEEIKDEWAISQVKSSVDYAHGSFFTTFLAGALNYQVTHHLFPGVSQYHYPAIAPIIMEVCKKYNVEYKVLPSFSVALMAHFRHLYEMGQQGKPVSVHMG
uniref:Delta-5 desaturase n=1 Tax=Pythium aphanidermatum TaxID=65070 RepID=S5UH42_PYTAP|nr:delta-5 desaturase [Pythium aphanidermatum]